MPILNEHLTFITMPQNVRKTFFGIPTKVFLPANTDLYRFLSPSGWLPNAMVGRFVTDPFFAGNLMISDCFVDYETFKAIPRFARESGLSVAQVAQPALGVRPAWNPTMSEFGWIRLCRPVYGFKGACNRRLYNSQLKGGGLDQIWIPNLTTEYAYPVGRDRVENLAPSPVPLGANAVKLRTA
jgi:hypothetical protein